ncbi:MAG: peptide ABC transporter substrate-binding protein [Anaerolineae bacterium]|nr:peptide ABC transporter substrate-binding protein [Anaerolineae bacterium]
MTQHWFLRLRTKQNGRFALLFLAIFLLLAACQNDSPNEADLDGTPESSGPLDVITQIVRQTRVVTPTATPSEVRDPIELDVGYVGSYPDIDPQKAASQNGLNLVESLFTGLTNFNIKENRVEPELAKSWEASDDGKTWTFNLRDDIFWLKIPESGPDDLEILRPVVAGDVVTAVHRVCQSETNTPDAFILFLIIGCEQVYNLAEVKPADLEAIGVKALDDTTLQFSLTKPAGYFLTLTTMPLFSPVPGEIITEYEDEWTLAENIITSGPFLLTSGNLSDTRTVLKKNPGWPLPKGGNADTVNIYFFEDENSITKLWDSKNLDISPLPTDNVADFLLSSPTKARLVTGQTMFYLAYNFDSGIFRDPKVRRAFSAAIDRDVLAEALYGGRAYKMRHLAPPGVIGALPIDDVGIDYDPDLARLLLVESGYTSCQLMPPFRFMVSSLDLSLLQAELVRDMWVKELDCTEDQIIIEQVQFGTLLANTRADAGESRPDIWELGWSSFYPDQQNWVTELLHCTDSENRSRRECNNIDELMRQAGQATDPEERNALYRRIENLLFSDEGETPMSPLYVRGRYLMEHNWVDYTPAHFGGEQYDTYVVDAMLKKLERSR